MRREKIGKTTRNIKSTNTKITNTRRIRNTRRTDIEIEREKRLQQSTHLAPY